MEASNRGKPIFLAEKDSKRTDRTLEFFSDENIHNTLMLERVLKTFALLRPDIGEFKKNLILFFKSSFNEVCCVIMLQVMCKE